jgi:hypothetical protein
MNNSNSNRIKIISSLPGRLRANAADLFRNEQIAFNIKTILAKSKGVLSVTPSKITGNVLIYYDNMYISESQLIVLIENSLDVKENSTITQESKNSSLLKILFNTLSPMSLFKRKYSKEIYENEYRCSKKIINTSLILSSIVFLFTSSISKALSILILGYPGILFSIALVSYYYTSCKLKYNNIYLKSDDSLYLVSHTNALLIDNELFSNKLYNYNKSLSHLSRSDFQKLVILQEISNPISNEMQSLIQNIRLLGITNIFIIGNHTNAIINYISYYLGIDIFNYENLQSKIDCTFSDKTKGILALMATNEALSNFAEHSYHNFLICVYKDNTIMMNSLKGNVNFEYNRISKLPLIIELSYFCNEISAQIKNSALTLNIVGMLLSVLGYLTPLYSMMFYSFNTLISILIIKLRLNLYKNFNKLSYTSHEIPYLHPVY